MTQARGIARRVSALGVCLGVMASSAGAQDPAAGEFFSGFAEIRNRFVSSVGGSRDVYRSVVNLGEGPRLTDAGLDYRDPNGRYADELHFSASAWGGDPYNTAHVDASLAGKYELNVNYRNVAYFNNLPSFANPLLSDGVLLSQRSLDVTRRQLDADLVLLPGKRVSPYAGFSLAQGFGRGRTLFVSGGDEFPVGTELDDRLITARGGVKLSLGDWGITLEAGDTQFQDRQEVAYAGPPLDGNRNRPILGRDPMLESLSQRYRADGGGAFWRSVLQATPAPRVSLSGQFLWSRPNVDVTQQLNADGDFFSPLLLTAYSGVVEQSLGDAYRPRKSGSGSVELRLHPRLRVIESFYTDRMRVAGASSLAQMLDGAPGASLDEIVSTTLDFRFSREQTDVVFDASRFFTLRGGRRYDWGGAETPPPSLGFDPERNIGKTRRHVALAGAAGRLFEGRLRLTADVEASPGNRTFFRTGLQEYQKGRASARLRIAQGLSVQSTFRILNNKNDDVDFDFQSRQLSTAVSWTPSGGRFTVLGDYVWSTIRSDIEIVGLPFFTVQSVDYRDRAHMAGAYVETRLPSESTLRFGGSLAVNRGSRPTDFYQPEAGFSTPLHERVKAVAQWRWYGFGENALGIESFRAHTFSAGLRFGL